MHKIDGAMKPTDFTLDEQMRITAHEIVKRKSLFHISEEDMLTLLEIKPVILADIEDIVNSFYAELVEVEGVAQVIGDAESLYRLRNHMQRYLRSLFEGTYDVEYVQSRLRIGLVHKRIGVPPKLYITAYQLLSKILREKLRIQNKTKSCDICNSRSTALENLMLFDLVLVFDTYIQGLVNEVKRSKDDLENYAHELENTVAKRTKELAEQASKDGLTGLYNQKTFFEYLNIELSRSQRRANNFTLCYFDLDNFKKANDTFGHKYGDAVLTNVATAIKHSLRKEDIGARYGGDEFCILFAETSAEQAKEICDRLITEFAKIDPECIVTFSIGLAEFTPESGLDADGLVKQADNAMYSSKKHPGNYITTYAAPPEDIETEEEEPESEIEYSDESATT
ncbi:GGDEF domain-containing protein [Halodesulfovibrio sp.]|uniref:GGDEF domain-containing protein n=1 Tax=Halodesulfovibrio sp. TaxID=1912772 RepID=UPI0025BA5AC5|nr:GGDEF domain-containing protein [Halodesulfovibrio sp.]